MMISIARFSDIALMFVIFSAWLRPCFVGRYPAIFGEKAPGKNREKMIDLTSKFGEINDIEYNKGSKI